MSTYSKTELKEKPQELGIQSSGEILDDCIVDFQMQPVKDSLQEQIELLINENKILNEKINRIQKELSYMEAAEASRQSIDNPIKKIENEIMVRCSELEEKKEPEQYQDFYSNAVMMEFKKIVELFITELKEYNSRTVQAEKKLCLLEDSEKRIKQEYCELSCEVKRLNSELIEKNKKIDQLEEYNKKIKNVELQLKLLQLKQKKKNFWEFWK